MTGGFSAATGRHSRAGVEGVASVKRYGKSVFRDHWSGFRIWLEGRVSGFGDGFRAYG